MFNKLTISMLMLACPLFATQANEPAAEAKQSSAAPEGKNDPTPASAPTPAPTSAASTVPAQPVPTTPTTVSPEQSTPAPAVPPSVTLNVVISHPADDAKPTATIVPTSTTGDVVVQEPTKKTQEAPQGQTNSEEIKNPILRRALEMTVSSIKWIDERNFDNRIIIAGAILFLLFKVFLWWAFFKSIFSLFYHGGCKSKEESHQSAEHPINPEPPKPSETL